jgi:hypothetical protein
VITMFALGWLKSRCDPKQSQPTTLSQQASKSKYDPNQRGKINTFLSGFVLLWCTWDENEAVAFVISDRHDETCSNRTTCCYS